MTLRFASVLVIVAGCGRFQFDGDRVREQGIRIGYLDVSSVAEFTHAGKVANFGVDDAATSQLEVSGGEIFEIAIWDVALTQAEIAAL